MANQSRLFHQLICVKCHPQRLQRVAFCNFTPQDGLHISCAIRPLAAVLEEFPCCSLKRMSQWVQPQPESLRANICVMRHTSIQLSGCLMIFYFFFFFFLFLANSPIEVHPQGSGVHQLTSCPQIHTAVSETSTLPLHPCLCERTVNSAWLQALCGDAATG